MFHWPSAPDAGTGTATIHCFEWECTVPLRRGDAVLDLLTRLRRDFGTRNLAGLLAAPDGVTPLDVELELWAPSTYHFWTVLGAASHSAFHVYLFSDLPTLRGSTTVMVYPSATPADLEYMPWTLCGTCRRVEFWWTRPTTTPLVQFRHRKLLSGVPLQLQVPAAEGVHLSWSLHGERPRGSIPRAALRLQVFLQTNSLPMLSHAWIEAGQEEFHPA